MSKSKLTVRSFADTVECAGSPIMESGSYAVSEELVRIRALVTSVLAAQPKIKLSEVPLKKTNIHFLFGPHADRSDAQALKDQLQNGQILIPEICEWRPEYLEILQSVADGKVKPEDTQLKAPANIDDYFQEFLQNIYRSKVKIMLADIPFPDGSRGDHNNIPQLYQNIRKSRQKAFDLAFHEWRKGRLKSALKYLRNHFQFDAVGENLREKYMRDRIETIVAEVQGEAAQEVNLLVTLGSTHSNIYQQFKTANLPSAIKTNIFMNKNNNSVRIKNFDDEAALRTKLGKTVSDELLARVLLELEWQAILADIKNKFQLPHLLIQRVCRYLAEKFSLADIYKISNEEDEGQESKFFIILAEKGLSIPKTKDQFYQLIDKIRLEEIRKYGRKMI